MQWFGRLNSKRCALLLAARHGIVGLVYTCIVVRWSVVDTNLRVPLLLLLHSAWAIDMLFVSDHFRYMLVSISLGCALVLSAAIVAWCCGIMDFIVLCIFSTFVHWFACAYTLLGLFVFNLSK